MLPATCAPKAAEHKHQRQLAALLLLLVSRLTTKSTCRQQNTMPLKDEQVPELHGKMPNVTSLPPTPTCGPHQQQKYLPTAKHHAIEGRTPPKAPADSKTPCHWRTNKSQDSTERCLTLLLKPQKKLLSSEVLLLLLAATATCYLLLVHQTQLPTTGCPTSYSHLWTAPATKAPADSKTGCSADWRTCEPALPPKAPADGKTPCHWRTNKSQNCTERCLTLLLKPY